MSNYNDYNYLDIYDNKVLGVEDLEDKINQLRSSRKTYKYIVKTIQSGDMLESEIYPVYERKKDIPERNDKEKPSKESQYNLNDKNARKKFIRKVNANFSKNDLYITLTYEDKYLPTEKQAKKDVTNYIRRLKNYRKKHGLPELKYIYVLEYVDEEEQHKSKKIRVHHHILINQMDRDAAEELWKRGRVNSKRLQPDDDFGLEGVARYLLKDPRGKRWYGSRNLKEPIINRSVSKLTRKKAEKLALEPDVSGIFEKMYKDKYKYCDHQKYISDITGGVYLYCRMRRRD